MPVEPGGARKRRAAAAAARLKNAKPGAVAPVAPAPPPPPPPPAPSPSSSSSGGGSSIVSVVVAGLIASAAAAGAYYVYMYFAERRRRREIEEAEAELDMDELEEAWETVVAPGEPAEASRTPSPESKGKTSNIEKPSIGNTEEGRSNGAVEARRPSQIQVQPPPVSSPAPAQRRPPGSRKAQRKITIAAKDTLLWNPSPDPESPNYGFLPQSVPFLQKLLYSSVYDVYLITEVTSVAEQDHVLELLRSAGLEEAGLDMRKVLFCSSAEGRAHMVRHLEPSLHVDCVGAKPPAKDSAMDRLWQHVPKMIRVVKSRKGSVDLSRRASIASWGADAGADTGTGGEANGAETPGNVETVESIVSSSLAKEIGFSPS